MIHRDVKPQNVLLTASGDAKVTDFGIAKAAFSPATTTGGVLGTASHISPEQALGKPVGPGSDLYSLGVVLYEMLTGKLPYEAETSVAVAMKHVNEPSRSPREVNPEVPKALDAITAKLLCKNPEDRYASAVALADDLQRVRSGLPPTAARERAKRTALRPPAAAFRRGGGHRSSIFLAALITLLLGVGLLAGNLALALTHGDAGVPQTGSSESASGGGGDNTSAQAEPKVPEEKQKEKAKDKEKGKEKGKGK